MSRDAYDFLDAIDEQLTKERRARLLVEKEARDRVEAAQAAEAKARVDATSRRANESFLIAEYERAGVAPPFTDGRGVPTVSLSMLGMLGWEIVRIGDQATLVRP